MNNNRPNNNNNNEKGSQHQVKLLGIRNAFIKFIIHY